ncbi:hypothetical protein GGI24_000201 [Coemansia furcata]|nr:hypothetical protein GGI24_000201 [Coemansia furcata]
MPLSNYPELIPINESITDIVKYAVLEIRLATAQNLKTDTQGDTPNAGNEARSPDNKRKLLPTAATTSQDPTTGRLGKRA